MSIEDIIAAANERDPNRFKHAVQDELNARIMSQLDTERQRLADSIFASDHEEIDMGAEDEEIVDELETEEEGTDEEV